MTKTKSKTAKTALDNLTTQDVAKLIDLADHLERGAEARAANRWDIIMRRVRELLGMISLTEEEFISFMPNIAKALRNKNELPRELVEKEKQVTLNLILTPNPFHKNNQ